MKQFVGLDGCKAGWLAVFELKGKMEYQILENLSSEWLTKCSGNIWIDIPIGLPSKGFNRDLDQVLRNHLLNRKSSVFNAPHRETLMQSDYQKASEINHQLCGKKLSKQTFYIAPKIKEIDDIILSTNNWIFESHPEFCFQQINQNQPLQHSKHTKEGQMERLNLLQIYLPNISTWYNDVLQNTKRQHFKPDDLLDAIILFLFNKSRGVQPKLLLGSHKFDAKGLKMCIAY